MGTVEDLNSAGEILNNIYNNLTNKYKITKNFDYDSLEYFSCSIFNTLFDYNLVNLNEVEKMNSSFIDLIDESNKVGVQVTKEAPNTKKLIRSAKGFDEYDVERIIVFFFSTSSAKKIKTTKGEEIWTIQTIENYLKKNPRKCKPFIETLKIWNDSNGVLPSDLIGRINDNTQIQIDEMLKKKKIDRTLLVQERSEQKKSLFFCGPSYSKLAFESNRTLFFNSSFGNFLAIRDNNEEYSFKDLINNNSYWNINFDDLDKRKNNIISLYHNSDENKDKNDVFQYSNRATYTIFNEMISTNNAFYSNVLSIVRSAGQGKTVFCCDLALFLIEAGRPCFFIAHLINSGNVYDEFKKQIERIGFNNKYGENLRTICNYMKISNRPIIVMVDALNEYGNISDAINCISDIIKDCRGFGVEPRIIVSSRNKKYEEFEENLKSISNGVFCLNPSYINNKEIRNRYFKHYGITVKENYFLENLFNQSRLFIKIFCDIYKNKKINFSKYDIFTLFSEYFDERAKIDMRDNIFSDKEEFFDTIKLVSGWMIKNKVYDRVPIKEFNVNQRANIKKIADGDIFNIVTDEKNDYISFVFEEFRDYFLMEYFKDKDASEISVMLSKNSASLDGLIRNIVLYRRNDNRYNKEHDLSYAWYQNASIDVILNLPYQVLDTIDRKILINCINKCECNNNEIEMFSVDKIIARFIHPYTQNSIFSIDFIDELNEYGLKNTINYLSSDYNFEVLLSYMKRVGLTPDYLKKLSSFIVKNKVILSYRNKKLFEDVIIEKYGVKKISDLDKKDFSEDDIDVLRGVFHEIYSN